MLVVKAFKSSRFQRVVKLVALSLLVSTSQVAYSNSEEPITSIHGGVPYKLVLPDQKGASKREPGLYVRNGNDWRLAIPGTIISPGVTGGVSLQFRQIAQQTNRYDILLVVDGVLTWATIYSDASLPDTYKKFSHIRNPVDGSVLELPKIQSADEINVKEVFHKTTNGNYPAILASMKHLSQVGSGITFAISPELKNANAEVKMATPEPWLLDWDYTQGDLLNEKAVLSSEHNGVISMSLIGRLSQAHTTDSFYMKTWRAHLARAYKQRNNGSQNASLEANIGSVPYIDILTGNVRIDIMPGELIKNGTGRGYLVHDPFNGKSSLFSGTSTLSYDEYLVGSPRIVANFEHSARSGLLVSSDDRILLDSKAHLVKIALTTDKRVFIFGKDAENKDDITELRPSFSQKLGRVTEASVYPTQSGPYIVVSWKGEVGKQTEIYEMQATTRAFQAKRSTVLTTNFYSAEEIIRRLNFSVTNNALLFDAATPPALTLHDYNTQHKPTTAHIDVVKSLEADTAVELYPQPLATNKLLGNLVHLQFEKSQLKGEVSGVYI
ncbi:MAG: hypothetical protein SGI74_14740 [Oligoflexia bacterium]|nr:hypothetical protein [Oligoflexia bacterium]